MKKRNYRINRKPMSNEETDKFKDFEGLMRKVKSNPIPEDGNGLGIKSLLKYGKNLMIISAIVLTGILAWSLLSRGDNEAEVEVTQDIQEHTELKDVVKAPFPKEDVPFEVFTINAQRDTQLFSKNGAQIEVKSNTFKTREGEMASGEIEVRFREFHNPLDIFRAGIPMQYDSAGSKHTFESQGMFQLEASQNGEPLANEFKKPIDVNLICKTGKPNFNEYYFDTTVGKWEYLKPCVLAEIEPNVQKEVMENKASEQEAKKEKRTVVTSDPVIIKTQIPEIKEPEMPKYPLVLKDKYAFKVDFDHKSFSELDPNVVFQVDESLSRFSSAYYNVNWDKVELKRSKHPERYTVVLSRGAKTLEVESYPALTPAAHRKLKENYERDLKLYNDYQIQLKEKQRLSQSANRPVISATQKATSELLANTKNQISTGSRFSWKISIRSAGYYNSDHPRPPFRLVYEYLGKPSPTVIPKFKINGKAAGFVQKFNVVNGVNMLMNSKERNRIAYSKEAKNVMWVIYGDKIAIANPEDFDKIGKRKEFTFKLTSYKPKEALSTLRDMMELE